MFILSRIGPEAQSWMSVPFLRPFIPYLIPICHNPCLIMIRNIALLLQNECYFMYRICTCKTRALENNVSQMEV